MIQILRDLGFGFSWLTSLTWSALSYVGFAFVDDTDLIHSSMNSSVPGEVLASDAQKMLTWWIELLEGTGGALRPDKSFWYLVDFKFSKGRWRYRTSADMPGLLEVSESDGWTFLLDRLEPSQARETLGVFIAMDGNWRAQKEALIQKSQTFATQL